MHNLFVWVELHSVTVDRPSVFLSFPQGDTSALSLETLTSSTINDLIMSLLTGLEDLFDDLPLLIDTLTRVLEIIFELDEGFLNKDKQISEVLHDWLDIQLGVSEDCLHLAVSTPWQPDGTVKKDMPVMFFIHGGAFAFGTQIRMGGERLQVNYDNVTNNKTKRLQDD